MTQLTPPPETESPIFEFTPGDLEPIDRPKAPKPFSMINLSAAQGLLKNAFRPILFTALGLHGILLFVPLTSVTQAKPKETAEPVKIKRLTDKVSVKSMPKVKVVATAKPSLPKVIVASSNPIVIKSPDTTPTPTSTPLPSPSASPPMSPPPTVTPAPPPIPPGNPNPPPNLDPESQKFASVIAGLRNTLNPGQSETDPDVDFLKDEDKAYFFTPDGQAKAPGSYISPSYTLTDVATSLKGQFAQFTPKSDYSPNGKLYEAKIGATTRYVSIVEAGGGIMVFLWEKSPV